MRSFWHPLSTILIEDPPCFATRNLLRMLMGSGPVRLRYAGDRMWPAVAHGACFEARTLGGRTPAVGTVVLASPAGIPDLYRVAAAVGGSLRLVADADPAPPIEATAEALHGVASLTARRPQHGRARWRRLWLDLREAWKGRPDAAGDPASTVRDKYDCQAAFYAAGSGAGIEADLLERIRERVGGGRRVLVVGSGAGRECFELARDGWRVTGVDFAPAMVEHARSEATRLGLNVSFLLGDVREHAIDDGSLDGVVFTYDVYSFIPSCADRVRVLQRLARALDRRGCLFLSARRLRSVFDRLVLTLQRAARRDGEWGDSHTRWIAADGALHRSYVRVFSERGLAGEIAQGGFQLEDWRAGHGLLLPRGESLL